MKKFFLILEMIKFEHTVFALPCAFLGAFLAARGFPGWESSLWIVLAMVGARSAAMAFNRLVDRLYDAINPRTANRALPQGKISPGQVSIFVVVSSSLFVFSSWMLNDLAFRLSPLALAIVLFYSYTKRFTSLSHLVLGLSLAIAPVGGWIAVSGDFDSASLWLGAAVLFWVGGFDIIYACEDYEFDRGAGLHSLPRRLGPKRALRLSALFHAVMIVLLIYAFYLFQLSMLSWIGLAIIAAGLIYEHRLANSGRLQAAFFNVNGLISVVLFSFVGVDLCLPA